MLVKGVAFRLASPLPPEAKLLLEDFRLAVNEAVRAGIAAHVSSRNALTTLVYRSFREEHPRMYAQHLVSSFEVAASILKNYRRRVSSRKRCSIPFARRLMMKAENQAYRLDRADGTIDLPIRAGLHVKLNLVVSQYHRRYLDDPILSLGSLTVLPDRVVVAFRREEPKEVPVGSVLSLDTNEGSLDGILIENVGNPMGAVPVKAAFQDVRIIQQRHHDRRRKFQKKKAHDRQISRNLCRQEGTRERNRISYRMHHVANAVVDFAEKEGSAIVLEDLKGSWPRKNKSLNRRLSLWPRRKLHQFIEYKAAWKGIPIVKVDPRYSSKRCPICGRIQYSRMGAREKEFKCECGWHLDRHINASLNLLQTAISNGLEVAGGLRFDPGAFQHDAMMILYEPSMAARSEPNGTSRVTVMA